MTTDHIDPAIVAAAQAIDWGTHKFRAGSPDWRVPACRCGWKASAPHAVSEFDLHIAELAVEAAAPLIAAKALRDEANRLEGMAYGRTGGYVDAGRHIIARIRDHAADLEAGQS